MGPLLNPITLVIALILTLFVTIVMFFPSLLVLILVAGFGYLFYKGRGRRKETTIATISIILAPVAALLLVGVIVPVVLLVCWFIAGFLMVL